jgi:hypothetical protein
VLEWGETALDALASLPDLTNPQLAALQISTFHELVRSTGDEKAAAKALLAAIETEMRARNALAASSRAAAARMNER